MSSSHSSTQQLHTSTNVTKTADTQDSTIKNDYTQPNTQSLVTVDVENTNLQKNQRVENVNINQTHGSYTLFDKISSKQAKDDNVDQQIAIGHTVADDEHTIVT